MSNQQNNSDNKEPKMNLTLVQMKLDCNIINSVNNIKKVTGIQNRTQIVANSIAFYEAILLACRNNGELFIEYPGEEKVRDRLLIPGITRTI